MKDGYEDGSAGAQVLDLVEQQLQHELPTRLRQAWHLRIQSYTTVALSVS
jgi:hypothetical protein